MRASHLWIIGISLSYAACAAETPMLTEPATSVQSMIVGRVVAVITGDSSRIYGPQVRFFELENQHTHERYHVEIKSDDQLFTLGLPPGDYRLTRVQISEGPFMSMADMETSFTVSQAAVTYVGTWRFGIDSPRYGRMVVLSMVADPDDRPQADAYLEREQPVWIGVPVNTVIPEPAALETRLYEVMPYPRYPSYFRRHNF